MKKYLFVFLFFLAACAQQIPSQDYCDVDSDCVCGGIDKSAQDCFVGNKQYYESGAVDTSKDCPDFCTGIGGHLVTKCVDNKCINVNRNTFPECSNDVDCVRSSCCHASSCVSRKNAPDCSGVFCTQVCMQGTLDCGGSCACEQQRCVTKNLYQQVGEVPVV